MCIKALRVLAQRVTHGFTLCTQGNSHAMQSNVTAVGVLLFANKTSTQYGFVYLGVGGRKFLYSAF